MMDLKELLPEFIDSVIKDYLEIKNQKVTSKEQEIINYYLGRGNKIYVTTSNLAEDLEINRTVAWKYLEKLTEKKVFRKIKYGNPSKYQINDVFLSFYEDELRKTIIFKQK